MEFIARGCLDAIIILDASSYKLVDLVAGVDGVNPVDLVDDVERSISERIGSEIDPGERNQ